MDLTPATLDFAKKLFTLVHKRRIQKGSAVAAFLLNTRRHIEAVARTALLANSEESAALQVRACHWPGGAGHNSLLERATGPTVLAIARN